MKKSWKERLYDFKVSFRIGQDIPELLEIFGGGCFICSIVSFLVFKCEILSEITLVLFLISYILEAWLMAFWCAIESYNKETLLRNKVRNLLFANDSFADCVVFYLGIICLLVNNAISLADTRVNDLIVRILIVIVIASLIISKPISKHFKKKIVYVGADDNDVKVN